MTEKDKNPYVKTRSVEISAELLADKAKMEAAIKKQEDAGWKLVGKRKVRNKARYLLTFEYHLSEQEIKAIKTKEASNVLGVVALIAVCAFFSCVIFFPPKPSPNSPVDSNPNSENASGIYYANLANVFVWTCVENADCEKVVTIPAGTSVEVVGSIEGREVEGSTVWYHVILSDDREGFIHSSVLSVVRPTRAPTARPSNNSDSSSSGNTSSSGSRGGNTLARPDNCTQARDWGYSAEQAAQWSHLDADNDGVACYGD